MNDQTKAPSIEQSFSTAYRTIMDNIVVVLANTVICIIAVGLSCITVIGAILVPAILGGYIESMLRLTRGEKVEIGKFFNAGFNSFGTFLGAGILMFIGVVIGLVLFILPGIYLGIVWSLVFYIIGDQGLGAGDALKKSRALVHSRFWEFVALIILAEIILCISALVPLAVIIGMPFSTMLISSYYDQLTKTDQSEEPPIEENPAGEKSTEDGSVRDSDFSV